jgi:hypothetical protein
MFECELPVRCDEPEMQDSMTVPSFEALAAYRLGYRAGKRAKQRDAADDKKTVAESELEVAQSRLQQGQEERRMECRFDAVSDVFGSTASR